MDPVGNAGAPRTLSRRGVLQGTLVGGSALAVSTLLSTESASADEKGVASTAYQVPGFRAEIDTTHATPGVARLLRGYFRDKSLARVEDTMSHFSRTKLTYIDATVGWPFDWQGLHDLFALYMPHWPKGSGSYPSRIMGDATSAVVFFTDTAGLFGPKELRVVGVVNFEGGKVTRWIDYWDGRHFGLANVAPLKTPDSKFPANFREHTVGETASKSLRMVTHGLAHALKERDYVKAVSYFGRDAVLTDHPSHVVTTGVSSIGSFLSRAGTLLPFIGPHTGVRHVVGSHAGGAYEWTNEGAVPRGVSTIELDRWGKISRLDAMWDGSRVADDHLLRVARSGIER